MKLFTTAVADSSGQISDGVAVSSTNTYYSNPLSGSRHALGYALHLAWTGTPTGTFTLWYSVKERPSFADDTDWDQDANFAPVNPAGAAGKYGDNFTVAEAKYWRIKYVNASGSGTLTGYGSSQFAA